MPWYRCILESEDTTVEMTLDVLTDGNNVVDRGLVFFGYWRDREVNDSEPLALNYNDTIDWGSTYTSTFPIRSQKIVGGLRVAYAGYKNGAAFERRDIHYQNDFILKSYRNYADDASETVLNIEIARS